MKNLVAPLRRSWQARSPSEQNALKRLAAVLLIALAGQLLWNLQQARQHLRQQLPRLASAAETMHQQLLAWQTLSAGAAPTRPALPHDEISRRLAQIDGALKITWRGEEQLELSGEIAFDAWIKEIGDLQRDYHLVVVRLQALPAATGRVTLEAELARSGTP